MAIRNDAGLMLELFYLSIFRGGREENIQCTGEKGSHGEDGRLFHRG